MGSFFCPPRLGAVIMGRRSNCAEAEDGAGIGESRGRDGEMEKPHPGSHGYLWLSTVFNYLHQKSPE